MKRVLRLLLLAVAIVGLGWPSGVLPAMGQEATPPPLAPNSTPAVGQRMSVTGLLTIKYGDPAPGQRGRHQEIITVRDDLGRRFPVAVGGTTQLGGPLHGLSGSRVTIVGEVGVRTSTTGADELVLRAEAIRPPVGARAGARAPFQGTVKWATLLCQFPGDPQASIDPYRPEEYFRPLVVGPAPSSEDYWIENSRTLINFAGSTFHDWKTLPKTREQYLAMPVQQYLDALLVDCAGVHTAEINGLGGFTSYGGVNVMLSKDLDPVNKAAWGGISDVTLGGVAKPNGWPSTWLPDFGYKNQNFVAHEMGHAFRLQHSSGPFGKTYDSKWDVMSDGGACRTRHPKYGCLGDHTNAYHKDFLEWIPAERRFTWTAGTTQAITLERSAQSPGAAGAFWSARIPIAGSATQFYTVEARKFVGTYDSEIPLEGVVLHRVDTARTENIAQVVDPDTDGNKDVNDQSANWTVGETFTDAPNGIAVAVLADTGTCFRVSIGPPGGAPPPPPPPAGCTATARGNVRVQTSQLGGGQLQVTVTALPVAGVVNTLCEMRLGVVNNAVIDMPNGGPTGVGAGGAPIALGNAATSTFVVRRLAPGPFLVRMTLVDASGTWPTFVGGGTNIP